MFWPVTCIFSILTADILEGARVSEHATVGEGYVATTSVIDHEPVASKRSWPESTRVWLFRSFFTNLCGITHADWAKVLRDNQFKIAPAYWHRAAILSAGGVLNTWYARREDRLFGGALEGVHVAPPVFVLGHWRSGTTLLHNLLALDDRFAYPNLYEVFFPHTFLSTEDVRTGLVAPLVPRTRDFDNVAQGLDMPNEDEFATACASLCSPYMAWAFPRNAARYERYLTFRDAPEADLARWKAEFVRFLKKLSYRYDRPLLLKSPPHTARVRLLLDLFPDARFVHVHRDPFAVFPSTRHLNDVLTRSLRFQPPDPSDDPDEVVIRRYRMMHDAYFEGRASVPPGRLVEIAFDDLESDPVRQIRDVYDALGLQGFDDVLPRLESYVEGLAGYRKNAYEPLPAGLKTRLRRAWARSFEEWGYPSR